MQILSLHVAAQYRWVMWLHHNWKKQSREERAAQSVPAWEVFAQTCLLLKLEETNKLKHQSCCDDVDLIPIPVLVSILSTFGSIHPTPNLQAVKASQKHHHTTHQTLTTTTCKPPTLTPTRFCLFFSTLETYDIMTTWLVTCNAEHGPTLIIMIQGRHQHWDVSDALEIPTSVQSDCYMLEYVKHN